MQALERVGLPPQPYLATCLLRNLEKIITLLGLSVSITVWG